MLLADPGCYFACHVEQFWVRGADVRHQLSLAVD
jgi:hypothetical protein